jgi:uncharacterized protein (DUF1501 family)
MNTSNTIERRTVLGGAATLAGGLAVPGALLANSSDTPIQGKADHVISIWLGGGMGKSTPSTPSEKATRKRRSRARITIPSKPLCPECRSVNT